MVECLKPERADRPPPDIRPGPGVVPISKFTYLSVFLLLPAAMLAGTAPHPVLAQNVTASRGTRRPLVFLDSSREADGLRGPVRRVRSEVAKLSAEGATVVEGPRRLLEVTVYDAGGKRAENKTYPVVSSPVGEESNVYDGQGNLAETILRDARGEVLSRTVYTYEFDAYGNWTKAVAAVAVVGPDGPALEPVEVTYRALTYYSSAGVTAPTFAAEEKPKLAAPAPEFVALEGAEVSNFPDVGEINGLALNLPPPAYPLGRKHKDGPVPVNVEVVVDETGRVVSAQAPRAPRLLREAAEEAARGAIFLPFRDGGVPSRVRGVLRYTFPYLP